MAAGYPIHDNSVFVFADLQHGIADGKLTVPYHKLGRSVAGLAKLAKLRAVPVIVSTVAMGQDSPPKLISDLEENIGEHQLFTRAQADSAKDEAIFSAIERTGRKSVLICGVFTEIAVALPAYTLVSKGYDVHVVIDACGGASERTENATMHSLMEAGVSFSCAPTIAGSFAGDFRLPEGGIARDILMSVVMG